MLACFESVDHPEGRPRSHIIREALVPPLAGFSLPLMIGTTAAVLMGRGVLLTVVIGLPLVLLLASMYAHFRLGQVPAELCLRPGEASVRSVRDILYRTPRVWRPLYDARLEPTQTTLTIGWRTLRCTRHQWPEHEAIQDAVRRARRPLAPTTLSPSS